MANSESDIPNERRIALWPGRNREKGANHPFFTGRLTLEGKSYFVVLWKRNRETDRQPLFSGQITPATDDEQILQEIDDTNEE